MISAKDLRAMTKSRQEVLEEQIEELNIKLQRAAREGNTRLVVKDLNYDLREYVVNNLGQLGYSVHLGYYETELSIYW
jgi:hypothetical protein